MADTAELTCADLASYRGSRFCDLKDDQVVNNSPFSRSHQELVSLLVASSTAFEDLEKSLNVHGFQQADMPKAMSANRRARRSRFTAEITTAACESIADGE